MNLTEQMNTVHSRKDFVSWLRALRDDLKENPDGWENGDLESFLDAMATWIEDMDGYYINRGEPVPQQPNWQVLADILRAAKIYE